MGCLFGVCLKNNAERLLLVDTWEEHVDAINRQGLVINNNDGKKTFNLQACLPQNVDFKPELIILFTKTVHSFAALNAIKTIITPQTYLLTLQNGIKHTDPIKQFFGEDKIIHGITTYPCDMIGPGHIRTKGDGNIKFMSLDGKSHEMLYRLDDLFKRSGLKSEVDPEVIVSIWEKLAFNAVMNPLTAVLRLNVGQLADSDHARKLAYQIVEEVGQVGITQGIKLDLNRVKEMIEMAFREHRNHMPSMLQDVLKQKKTEIDFINGSVADIAYSAGVSAPLNETLFNLVKTLEKSYLDID